MAQIKNPLTGGGGGGGITEIINGVLEQLKSDGSDISAATFVEKVTVAGAATVIATGGVPSQFGGYAVSAATLDDDRAILAFYNSSKYPTVSVLNFSDGAISIGASTVLVSTASNHVTGIAVTALSPTRAIVLYSGTNSSYYLYGSACTISGETITAGSSTQMSSTSYTGAYMAIERVSDAHAVCTMRSGSSNFYYNIMGINADNPNLLTITSGTSSRIGGNYISAGEVTSHVTNMGNGYIFVGFPLPYTSGGDELYGKVYSYTTPTSLTAITSDTLIDGTTYSGRVADCISWAGDGAFIANFSGKNVKITYCGFDEENGLLNLGEEYIISTVGGAVVVHKLTIENTGNGTDILVTAHGNFGDSVYHCYTVTLDGVSVSTTSESVVPSASSANLFDTTRLGANNVLLCARQDSSIVNVPPHEVYVVSPATNSKAISGLTATTCTADTPGDVWVLNTSSTTN